MGSTPDTTVRFTFALTDGSEAVGTAGLPQRLPDLLDLGLARTDVSTAENREQQQAARCCARGS